MDGLLNVCKHAGPTSHDVVYSVRKIFGQKRVGHAGTLDPMATGVLIVCLGKATRVVEYLMGAPKEYRARIVLGQSTDTQDSTGTVIEQGDASGVTRDAFGEAVAGFVGEIEQVPPMVSALKVNGRPLYKLAREGKTVDRAARRVTVYSIDILSFTPGERAQAEMLVKCSGGTYIRTLCADIGERLGVGGHMSMLERTKVGRFAVEDAVSVEDLAEAASAGRLEELVLSIDDALGDLPRCVLTAEQADAVSHGLTAEVGVGECEGETVRMVSVGGELIGVGLAERVGDHVMVRPKKIFVEVSA